jgi:hypothetical protein
VRRVHEVFLDRGEGRSEGTREPAALGTTELKVRSASKVVCATPALPPAEVRTWNMEAIEFCLVNIMRRERSKEHQVGYKEVIIKRDHGI